jgi:hypothetical protein
MAANKSVRAVRGPPNTPLLHVQRAPTQASPIALPAESGESLRHVKCYSAMGGWGSMKARGGAESMPRAPPRPPVTDHSS